MSNTLDQILAIIRSVMDDKQKLNRILEFLEEEILIEEEFKEIEIPEKFKPCITEIAGSIDAGLVCFFNPETLAIDAYPRDLLHEVDLFGDEPEEVKKNLSELYGWDDVKVLDWLIFIEFTPPDSHESFRIMEAFAERLKNADKLKNKLIDALNNRKPFANFKNIIDNSDHRQDWFDFKVRWLENSVAAQLMEELDNFQCGAFEKI
ncbi:UPF0158 family protein [Petrimonas sulfuriphila]|jgi:hypothetical protein|uniref:UPF0158 family protein n=1 Tax=Petrimonas sulfuriphila TaxID=285070 RepID=UPI003EBDB6FA